MEFCAPGIMQHFDVEPYFKSGTLKLLEYEGGHVFTREMRDNAYELLIDKLK